ncbi:hypothetical protein [Neisseria bergeri]|uniref:hypothetical protein n=1 Tax=Neisseria bergeri TaxID=1906581 RepID=UPI00142DF500|nr:hypothetical protein [Neisseria bergeri]
MPSEARKRFRRHFYRPTPEISPDYDYIVDQQKSGQGDEAADSTNSTEPIHLVLQHLRESFSLS